MNYDHMMPHKAADHQLCSPLWSVKSPEEMKKILKRIMYERKKRMIQEEKQRIEREKEMERQQKCEQRLDRKMMRSGKRLMPKTKYGSKNAKDHDM
ncbi:hypothetical protein INR49_028957, partial [Caranx melampygus]